MNPQKKTDEVSFELSRLATNTSRPFIEDDFVKKMLTCCVTKPLLREMLEAISLNRMAVQKEGS
jgi:hypothetical protein